MNHQNTPGPHLWVCLSLTEAVEARSKFVEMGLEFFYIAYCDYQGSWNHQFWWADLKILVMMKMHSKLAKWWICRKTRLPWNKNCAFSNQFKSINLSTKSSLKSVPFYIYVWKSCKQSQKGGYFSDAKNCQKREILDSVHFSSDTSEVLDFPVFHIFPGTSECWISQVDTGQTDTS